MCVEGSKNIFPWFSRFSSDSITFDMLLENDGDFGKEINGTDIHPDSMYKLVGATFVGEYKIGPNQSISQIQFC